MSARLHVRIHEDAWKVVSKEEKSRRRLETVVRRIAHFCEHGLRLWDNQIRKVPGGFKLQFSRSHRMPFTLEATHEGHWMATLWAVLDHREGESLHRKGIDLPSEPLEYDVIDREVEALSEEEVNHITLYQGGLFRIASVEDVGRVAQGLKKELEWYLYEEQRALVEKVGPVLVNGAAGSGKTTVALYRMLTYTNNAGEAPLYVTYTARLKRHAEALFRQLTPLDARAPSFWTLEELCRAHVEDSLHRFPVSNFVGAQQFRQAPFLRGARLPSSPDVLWEEFRGVIKGGFQNVHAGVPFMERAFYLNEVSGSQSHFNPGEKVRVYDLFLQYTRWLEERGYWDDIDLARAAIAGSSPTPYAQVIVDEVQDLTTYHVEFLLRFCGSPEGLFLAGDPQQVIHPSRFEWSRIKEQVYRRYMPAFPNVRNALRPHTIQVNFRSARPIVDVANQVVQWRREGPLNDRFEPLVAVREGLPVCRLNIATRNQLSGNRRLSHRLMVIVPNETAAEGAIAEFGREFVFTVHESKGLEADFVILWKFFSPEFEEWLFQNGPACRKNGNAERLRYQTNLLNVALTRAREELYFVGEDFPSDWAPFQGIPFDEGQRALVRLQELLSLSSQTDEYFNRACEIEEAGNFEQAISMFERAGAHTESLRVRGRLAEVKKEWREAAQFYYRAGQPGHAARCFELAGMDFERFEILLRMPDEEAFALAEEYVRDVKKLVRLKGNVAQAVVRSLAETGQGAHLDTLYRYTLGMSRLQRDQLREHVQDLDRLTQTSRDYTRTRKDILTKLDALNATLASTSTPE